MGRIRENWRIVALAVLLLASAITLFVPGVGVGSSPDQGANESSLTNLRFGLDLDGGTSITAPLVGVTAEDVDAGQRNQTDVERSVAAGLPNVSSRDVIYRLRADSDDRPSIEVRANVSTDAFEAALEDADVSYGSIRQGVSEETRQEAIQVIRDKIDRSGLAGGAVQQAYSVGDNRWYVQIEIPGRNVSESIDLIQARGEVRIAAYQSVQRNGSSVWANETVVTQEGLGRVSIPQRSEEVGPHVPVTIEDTEADSFQQAMVDAGIATETGSECGWPGAEDYPGSQGPCILIFSDGEVIASFGMEPELGQSMVDGQWVRDPSFVLPTSTYSEAQDLSIVLRAGTLPTDLLIQQGSIEQVSASQGETFKTNALITGLIAVLAVAGVVFLRYNDPRVAAPMLLTALSEVFIMLGFASTVGMALDLSHIAGFIAVIGTGADDLIIIADGVISEGKVGGGRVFENRFRKAFWVIGVAAITTIVAMSPMYYIQQLRGFAIVTILGVLVGVLVTRPAYGDILRALMTEK